MHSWTIRSTDLWRNLHSLLQDSRCTPSLIESLMRVRSSVRLNSEEYVAFFDGYDWLTLFGALGMGMKGEDTDNTKLVADVLFRHREDIRPYLSAEINSILDNCPD